MPNGDFKQGANLDAFLAGGQIAAANTDTTVHTVAASTREKLATFSLTNVGAAAVTVSVSLVPSGGTVDGTHRVLSGYSLTAGDTISHEDVLAALKGVMLPAGAFISVNAATAAAINWTASGSVSS